MSAKDAAALLQASGRLQRRALFGTVDASAAAHHRRVFSEAAWALLTGATDTPALSEARLLAQRDSLESDRPPSANRLVVTAALLLQEKLTGEAHIAKQIFACVVRPLGEWDAPQGGVALDQISSAENWQRLAETIEALIKYTPDAPLIEALAGLKRLCGVDVAHSGLQEPMLRLRFNGPYLLSGARLTNHLGETLDDIRPTALCRCGRSGAKPYCDGSHVLAEFTAGKDPRRVTDRRDTYPGQVAVIFDNRGLCAHSGFCSDRLNSVFHLGGEPFVTPSGGRLDDIVRAARKCPSGALSFGLDGKEVREHVDQSRNPSVEVSRNGPYRVTGAVRLLDEPGEAIDRPAGASLEHHSLCRCGASLNKPFCSGMHWTVNFTDPVVDPSAEPTLFEWAGGYPALLDMTTIFYEKYVPQDPLIGPLFADMSPDHPQRVASWLSEIFGGPKLYSERYGGYARMISQHVGKNIKPEQRQRWASLMVQSADDAGLPADAEFRAAFLAYIEWGSRIAVENSGPGAKPPPNMPMPRWWWVCNATPGARPTALAADQAESPAWSPPSAGQPVDFENHIKPLFRPMDRNSMKFAFDLWSEADLRTHGQAILNRLKSGTMPCDGPWPSEKVAVFEEWLKTA